MTSTVNSVTYHSWPNCARATIVTSTVAVSSQVTRSSSSRFV